MFSSLLLTAALTLAQGDGGKLEITNVRPTYGHLGAVRPKGEGILPGDVASFTFDIKNLKHDPTGKAQYSVAIEIRDGDGEIVYQQQPQNAIAQNFVENPTYFPPALTRDPEKLARMVRHVPAGRLARGEESARLAVYLASEDADFFVGQVIPFAGGWVTP